MLPSAGWAVTSWFLLACQKAISVSYHATPATHTAARPSMPTAHLGSTGSSCAGHLPGQGRAGQHGPDCILCAQCLSAGLCSPLVWPTCDCYELTTCVALHSLAVLKPGAFAIHKVAPMSH